MSNKTLRSAPDEGSEHRNLDQRYLDFFKVPNGETYFLVRSIVDTLLRAESTDSDVAMKALRDALQWHQEKNAATGGGGQER